MVFPDSSVGRESGLLYLGGLSKHVVNDTSFTIKSKKTAQFAIPRLISTDMMLLLFEIKCLGNWT